MLEDQHRLLTTFRLDKLSPADIENVSRAGQTAAKTLRDGTLAEKRNLILELLTRVTIYSDRFEITIGTDWISKAIASGPTAGRPSVDTDPSTLVQEIQLKRRGVEMKMIIESSATATNPDEKLLKAVAQAHTSWDRLCDGGLGSVRELADQIGKDERHVARILNLRFLAPRITEAIVEGRQPVDLTAERLLKKTRLPLEWFEQIKVLGC